jgi:hypothetical protein
MPFIRAFGNIRPSLAAVAARGPVRNQRARGNERFYPLPPPTGTAPFHLDLADILKADEIAAIKSAGQLVFHVAGDTGGVKRPEVQQIVADKMEEQLHETGRPAFFYHLGDVVYYNGEAREYYPQFYQPYENYNIPTFAIPGNHDGDPGQSGAPSLDAFMRNFCALTSQISPDAGDVDRVAMIQPNCYFTLVAPFATIIGLYSNVPEGGQIEQDQLDWLKDELRTAPQDRALLLAVHHPAFSFDDNHSGSAYIRDVLDDAFGASGRLADVVLTAHVHNYQRFTRRMSGRQVPFLVAGAGGYWHLHGMRKAADGRDLQVPLEVPGEDLTLDDYFDDRHGFLKFTVTAELIRGEYFTVPRPHEPWSHQAHRYDSFSLDWRNGRLLVPHA